MNSRLACKIVYVVSVVQWFSDVSSVVHCDIFLPQISAGKFLALSKVEAARFDQKLALLFTHISGSYDVSVVSCSSLQGADVVRRSCCQAWHWQASAAHRKPPYKTSQTASFKSCPSNKARVTWWSWVTTNNDDDVATEACADLVTSYRVDATVARLASLPALP